MELYKFNPEQAFNIISDHWKKWASAHGTEKWVIGISGGVDSSVTAALAAKIFGYDHVLGVLMPNGEQKDIEDSKDICRHLKIEWCTVNIGKTYEELLDEVVYGALRGYDIEKASADTITNMPARLRMTALYAIAQSTDRMVLNTCNLSESTAGYDTLWGDDAGSYAPIQRLTKTEVIALGDWLGLPHNLTHKTPIDGLQPKTDEEKLGFSYSDLDRYIREDIGTPELKAKVDDLYRRNKFKTDMVQLPGPHFSGLPNYVSVHEFLERCRDFQKPRDADVAAAMESSVNAISDVLRNKCYPKDVGNSSSPVDCPPSHVPDKEGKQEGEPCALTNHLELQSKT